MFVKKRWKPHQKKILPISVDLNYRSRLWKYGKQPTDVMPELVTYCDVVMGNIWSANSLLGTSIDENIHDKKSKQAYLGSCRENIRGNNEDVPEM